jgi:hypothetical protein
MYDERMLGIPNRPEKGVIKIDLPMGWINHDHPAFRVADVGAPCLTFVAALSLFEAATINREYLRRAEDELRKHLAEEGDDYIGQNLDENAVSGAKRVEQLLEAIKEEGYFSSWVLIESCTID